MSQTRVAVCPSCGGLNRLRADGASQPTCGRCKAALDASGAPLKVDDDALERIVRSSPVPVLVDFYADWCMPCRQVSPVLDQLGRRYAGRVLVLKVDTERHQRVASQLGVRGIPAVYLYKGGRVVDEAAGAYPAPHWEAMVRPHLVD